MVLDVRYLTVRTSRSLSLLHDILDNDPLARAEGEFKAVALFFVVGEVVLYRADFVPVVEGDEIHTLFDFLVFEEYQVVVTKNTIVNGIVQIIQSSDELVESVIRYFLHQVFKGEQDAFLDQDPIPVLDPELLIWGCEDAVLQQDPRDPFIVPVQSELLMKIKIQFRLLFGIYLKEIPYIIF